MCSFASINMMISDFRSRSVDIRVVKSLNISCLGSGEVLLCANKCCHCWEYAVLSSCVPELLMQTLYAVMIVMDLWLRPCSDTSDHLPIPVGSTVDDALLVHGSLTIVAVPPGRYVVVSVSPGFMDDCL